MTTVGIDKISFFSPHYYLDMVELAEARNEEPNKYLIGIGQTEQAVIPSTQDIVSMGANAAEPLFLSSADKTNIDMILFATESGVDNSKSAAVYVQKLLGLNRYARTIEVKQACYAGTFALMQARDYVCLHPDKRVLVIAADIARYGLKTSGEVTQGGGAVAMLVAANPKILALEEDNVFMSDDIMDFWRPVYATEALVDGHFSQDVYRDFFKEVWQRYKEQTTRTIDDFKAFVFHLPYTKQGLKALRDILPEADEEKQTQLMTEFEASRVYNKRIGNLYTGSLYLSLLSLLENSSKLQAGDRLGLFSYGSGAEGEFYSAIVQANYRDHLIHNQMRELLSSRQQVSVTEYEAIFMSQLMGPVDRSLNTSVDPAHFVLTGLIQEQRQYQRKKGKQC